MLATYWFRMGACLSVVVAGCSLVSGCASSPTYGTDKTAMEQLTDDLGQSVSLTGPDPKNKGVKYTPRPTLVLPAQAQKETLVAPQQTVANKDNPQWLESPEETRARLVSEADANEDNPNYRSPLASSAIEGGRRTTEAQTKAYREARALQKAPMSISAAIYQIRRPATAPSTIRQSSMMSASPNSRSRRSARRMQRSPTPASSGGTSCNSGFFGAPARMTAPRRGAGITAPLSFAKRTFAADRPIGPR